MDELKFRTVSLSELSALSHEIAIVDGPSHEASEFLIVRYSGAYRSGGQGRPDALYIVATAAAARAAWWAPCTILDFRKLEYSWGDEMEWVTSITWDHIIRSNAPFAVVVGDRCRDALQSLLRERYECVCVETLERAIIACRQQKQLYDKRLKEFRRKP